MIRFASERDKLDAIPARYFVFILFYFKDQHSYFIEDIGIKTKLKRCILKIFSFINYAVKMNS